MTALTIRAACLDGCGTLATGTTGQPPSNRRYDSRWAELDALTDKHTRTARHATSCSAQPEETR